VRKLSFEMMKRLEPLLRLLNIPAEALEEEPEQPEVRRHVLNLFRREFDSMRFEDTFQPRARDDGLPTEVAFSRAFSEFLAEERSARTLLGRELAEAHLGAPIVSPDHLEEHRRELMPLKLPSARPLLSLFATDPGNLSLPPRLAAPSEVLSPGIYRLSQLWRGPLRI
jgi:hypothetical protein